uniref:Uncharacterized protein n=1 Tax=viral metagenome TaxID=1070528 RepID=A0A6C0KB75_9ZZZZ
MGYYAVVILAGISYVVYINKHAILCWLYHWRKDHKPVQEETDSLELIRVGPRVFSTGRLTILTETDTSQDINFNIPMTRPIMMASLHPGDLNVTDALAKFNHPYHTRKNILAKALWPTMSDGQTLEILLRDGWLEDVGYQDRIPI